MFQQELPQVAIIILNWNGIDYTTKCLTSLQKVSYPHYKVILVDNGSNNNEGEALYKKFRNYIYLIQNDKNLGFAEGNNIGIRYAIKQKFKYIVTLNNDIEVDPNFLNALVKVAEQNNQIGMVAAKTITMKDKISIDNLGLTLTLSGIAFNRKDEKQKLFCPSGGAALYRISMLKSVELFGDYFDSNFFAYVEDLDLGCRAIINGYEPGYAKNAIVFHYGSASTKPMSPFAVFNSQKNLIWTIIKNFPIKIIIKNSFWIFSVQIGVLILNFFRGRLLLILRADFFALKKITYAIRLRKLIQAQAKIKGVNFNIYIENRIILSKYLKKIFNYM